ncbi:exodeoxyribonuclease V subunit beta [Marinobacterium lutimaris]|uniref:RecBCD enzyme subunit RecB n=1 Tax=Marinobacterium lutimaris TaxID=568106 RepID=A0A1H6CU26_9GAMM|nr:exodeoxyribonuclease V subunit beta [Marinobacterium lutimaris]SEG76464.1 DNA helicase/exodeoxyribonuclease V, beta subunit [Marinobacterium lutimaris]
MSDMIQLDPLAFPLHGRRLIEASAGTGKTYTIAALYLRLVLGHGKDSAHPRALLPPEILVVTFTNAATRELRERIRDRLSEGARVFRAQQEPRDPFLTSLLNDPAYADDAARAAAAHQLDQAAQWMDEAAIYTIHGWSQRMLTQHAFDSGSLFDQELEGDDSEIVAEAVRDYWRTYFYPLPEAAARSLKRLADQPDKLAETIRPLLKNSDATLYQAGEPLPAPVSPTDFASVLVGWEERRESLQAFARNLWCRDCETVEGLIFAAVEKGALSKQVYKAEKLPEQFQSMLEWSQGDEGDAKLLANFGSEKLRSKTNKKFQPDGTPQHEVFDALQQLADHLETSPDLNPVRVHAARWVAARVEQNKRRVATLGFDDLLTRLAGALADEDAGPRLARQIVQQYPVALIDEFQDTDPTQYQSFRRIYADADPERSALLMIGDPKQAIYAFRGADIHTYLKARRDCAGALYTLGTNFRSSESMVAAVNTLFEEAEDSQSAGAFQFGSGEDNPLPFMPVEANGRKERLELEGEPVSALTAWHLGADEAATKPEFRAAMANTTASQICRLLNLSQQGQAGFRLPDATLKPLRPGDIAILVRTGSEAQLIRQALEKRDVRSVYLSDRESVFDSQESQDLWRWLKACAEPEQPGLIHEALASQTLGLALVELERLNRDELLWEQRVELFRSLRDHWRRHGVLALIRRWLDAFELPARLLQSTEGERVLTNLLHLGEILQQASQQLDGELALVRWLAEQLVERQGDAEERVLRLESDADRVQVITIHKSKGLEYPLVFLPFISDCRPVSARNGSYLYHDEAGGTAIELDKDDKDAQKRADQERLQEDLRLLYVALTRPVHACWIGLAELKDVGKSALGQLLSGSEASIETAFTALCTAEVLALEPLPAAEDARLPVAAERNELRPAERVSREPDTERWWIASYSAIARLKGQLESDQPATNEAAETADDDNVLETRDETPGLPLIEGNPDIHRFWKGPAAGTFLHGMLEWAADEGFDRVVVDEPLRAGFLEPRCQRRDWEGWRELLDDWLVRLLDTPLPLGDGESVRLAGLETAKAEMEFWFSSAALDVSELDRRVRKWVLPGEPRPELEWGQLNGMLKGFIDLLFEHEGRYWVADYKSNWLGTDSSAYTESAMREAILHKRYDLQYVLYTLALHRLLKSRLPDYAADPAAGYQQYVGGSLYLFLRGIEEPTHHGAFVDRPPVELILELDDLFAGKTPINSESEEQACG